MPGLPPAATSVPVRPSSATRMVLHWHCRGHRASVRAIDVQAWYWMRPVSRRTARTRRSQASVLGMLGKTGNCQIGVSVHAVGHNGTVPLGWALYLPEEWCEDSERRLKAKIPDVVVIDTSRSLRSSLWNAPLAGNRQRADPRRLRVWAEHRAAQTPRRAELQYCCRYRRTPACALVPARGPVIAMPGRPACDRAALGPRAREYRRADRATRTDTSRR